MAPLLKYLGIPLDGKHHLGMDDTFNIGKIMIRVMEDGAIIRETANRRSINDQTEFVYEDRIGKFGSGRGNRDRGRGRGRGVRGRGRGRGRGFAPGPRRNVPFADGI